MHFQSIVCMWVKMKAFIGINFQMGRLYRNFDGPRPFRAVSLSIGMAYCSIVVANLKILILQS